MQDSTVSEKRQRKSGGRKEIMLACVLLLCYYLLLGGHGAVSEFTQIVYSTESSAECGHSPLEDAELIKNLKETTKLISCSRPLQHNAATDQSVVVRASSSAIASLDYLQLNVSKTCSKIRSIQLKCSSHDQGHATHAGTGSYSWGDIVVKSMASNGTEIYRHFRAFNNAVANSTFQDHSHTYGEQDTLVQMCTPGSTLILVLNAQYSGWRNFARSAKLLVKCSTHNC